MVLTLSLMGTLIYMCFKSQQDIKNCDIYIKPILVSKFLSTFFFFYFFLTHQKSLAYFAGMLIDGSVFLITYFFYRAARK